MIIHVPNKNTLIIDDFKLRCCVGKKGINYNTIPIVVLLSTKTEEHITMAKNIDAKAWLQKPFDKKRFLMVLDKILS